jgi:hypothetical protein
MKLYNPVVVTIIIVIVLMLLFLLPKVPKHDYGYVSFKTALDGRSVNNVVVYIDGDEIENPYAYNQFEVGQYSVYAEHVSEDKKWLYQTETTVNVTKERRDTVYLQFTDSDKKMTWYGMSIIAMLWSAGIITVILVLTALMGTVIGGISAVKNYFISFIGNVTFH